MCRFVLKRLFIICNYIRLYRYITIEKFGDTTCRCVLKRYFIISQIYWVLWCTAIERKKTTELGSSACLLGRMHANGSTSLSVAFADGERVCVPYGNQPIFWLSTQHGKKCMGSELVMEASQVFTIQMSEKVLRLAKSKHTCTDWSRE